MSGPRLMLRIEPGDEGTIELVGYDEPDRLWLVERQEAVMRVFASACHVMRRKFISKTLLKKLAQDTQDSLRPRFDARVTVGVEQETHDAVGKPKER